MINPSGQGSKLRILYWFLIFFFVGIVFLIDWVTPLGVAIGFLYIFPLFLSVFLIDERKAPIILSLVCCGLIVLNLYFSEANLEYWKAVVNRVLSVVFILCATIVAVLFKRSMIQRYWSEEKMTAALDGAPNGVLIVRANGTIEYANRLIRVLFGYGKDEILGKNVDLLVPMNVRSVHSQYRAQFLRNPSARAMGAGRDLYGLRKDGSEIPIEIGLTPFKTSEGIYTMASIVDIGPRKIQEQQLKNLNANLLSSNQDKEKMIKSLERSNQELDDFAYIASHDLKEPLRGLFNNAKFLEEDYSDKLDEGGIKRLQRISFLCQRIEHLINDLLYFSRLGRQELAIQKTNLNEVIEDIVSLMETSLQEDHAEVRVVTTLPEVVCDRPRVTEVFRNLITNAVKYNDKAKKSVEIGWLNEVLRDQVTIKGVFFVRDNGIGIESQFYEEVFRIFKRLNEEDDGIKGTGVGLTFVRKIIERHGGKIWLESKLGEGTTFYFTLGTGGQNGKV